MRVYARPAAIKLYVVHGSHPCAAVAGAMEIKGLQHEVVVLPPALHAALQRVRFGARTVPAIQHQDGSRLARLPPSVVCALAPIVTGVGERSTTGRGRRRPAPAFVATWVGEPQAAA